MYSHRTLNAEPESNRYLGEAHVLGQRSVSGPKWHVVYTRVNHENKIAQHLVYRDVEHFLPSYRSIRRRKDRCVSAQSPLFPGYIFVRLVLVQRMKVLTIPGVIRFVGPQVVPAEVSQDEIQRLQWGIAKEKILPFNQVAIGDRVLIVDGPLSGIEGVLLRNRTENRVVVTVNAIARAFSVELDISSLRILNKAA